MAPPSDVPKDPAWMVYIGFYCLGMATLLPWNFFITGWRDKSNLAHYFMQNNLILAHYLLLQTSFWPIIYCYKHRLPIFCMKIFHFCFGFPYTPFTFS
jgi:hypothetical protein